MRQIVPANPGYSVLMHRTSHPTDKSNKSWWEHEPVIAWAIDESIDEPVRPVTIKHGVMASGHEIVYPNGKVYTIFGTYDDVPAFIKLGNRNR